MKTGWTEQWDGNGFHRAEGTRGKGLDRRAFLRMAAGATAAGLVGCGGARAAERGRPNIVFILTDDQRWDMLSCAGHPILRTPQMDALAAEGVRFTNMFVTTSICAASRASIFTGLFERTHGYTFGTPPIRKEHAALSYPVRLRAAGYRTGFVGKFGVGVEGNKQTKAAMFDTFRPLGRNPYFKKRPDGSERHLTDITGDLSIEFLQGCRKERPFCLSISFNAPHAEDNDPRQYIWPKAEDGLYEEATIPPPALGEPGFFAKQPEFLKLSLNRIRWHWRFDTPEKYQRMVKGYFRMISGVDRVIGRVRAELERLGQAENTIIIVTGDNGYFLGERGFAGKWTPYEDSLRVPLIVYDPRAARGRRGKVAEQDVLNIDLAPTMLEMAGVAAPAGMQGRSLVGILRGERPRWREDFFFEHLFERKDIPKLEGVRAGRWKYFRFFEQTPVHEEMYDLVNDPREAHNLVGEAGQAKVLARLRKRCDELRDAYGGVYKARKAKS